MRAAVLAAAAAAALAAPRAASAQPAPATRPTTGAGTVGEDVPTVGITVPELLATLTAPNSSAAARRDAALRLVARQSDDARAALRQVATSVGGNLEARVAALRALADDANPSPGLLGDLLALLNPKEHERVVDADAQALAAYKREPRVIAALSAVALDAGRARAHRLSAAHALGLMPGQPAASALVQLVTNPNENADVVAAAADALVDMTGLESNGRDAARWGQWWKETGGRSPAEWADALMPARAAREDRLRRRVEENVTAQYRLLREVYDATSADDKPRRLLRYLADTSPDTRRAGARIAGDQAATLDPASAQAQINEAVQARLVELIGDADPGVRLDTLRALEFINVDAGPLLAVLLPQLGIETDSNVKAAMARKISRVPSLKPMPDLSRLLDDASPAVVREAADAIKRRAPALLQQDPALAKQTAEKLRVTMQRLSGRGAFVEARRACGEALAVFKDDQSLRFSRELLRDSREPPLIRGVALMILGELGAKSAAIITDAVNNERDAKVKVEGIRALAKTESFDESSEWLFQRMNDPEPEVRDAANTVYRALLPRATAQKLAAEADRRKGNVALRIDVLKALVSRLQEAVKSAEAAGRPDQAVQLREEIARTQQNIGVEYLRNLKPPQPEQAVPHLRDALDHYRRRFGLDVTRGLVEQLIIAMLQSRQYAELAAVSEDFVATATPEDAAAFRFEIGSKMRNEAEALVRDYERRTGPKWQDNLGHASALVNAALGMPNALDPPYRKQLTDLGARVEQLRATR